MLLQLAIGGAGILRLSEHVVARAIQEGLLQPLLQNAQGPRIEWLARGDLRGVDSRAAPCESADAE